MRFPYLLDEMRLKGKNNSKVILACVALNNYIINTGGGYFEEVDQGLFSNDEEFAVDDQPDEGGDADNANDNLVREVLTTLV